MHGALRFLDVERHAIPMLRGRTRVSISKILNSDQRIPDREESARALPLVMEPRASFRWLSRVDSWVNRIYGSRYNPLYHSGAITIVLLLVLLLTGLYLLLLYRIGAPYES